VDIVSLTFFVSLSLTRLMFSGEWFWRRVCCKFDCCLTQLASLRLNAVDCFDAIGSGLNDLNEDKVVVKLHGDSFLGDSIVT